MIKLRYATIRMWTKDVYDTYICMCVVAWWWLLNAHVPPFSVCFCLLFQRWCINLFVAFAWLAPICRLTKHNFLIILSHRDTYLSLSLSWPIHIPIKFSVNWHPFYATHSTSLTARLCFILQSVVKIYKSALKKPLEKLIKLFWCFSGGGVWTFLFVFDSPVFDWVCVCV